MTQAVKPGNVISDFLIDISSVLRNFHNSNTDIISYLDVYNEHFDYHAIYELFREIETWDELVFNGCVKEEDAHLPAFRDFRAKNVYEEVNLQLQLSLFYTLQAHFTYKWCDTFQHAWDEMSDSGRMIAQAMCKEIEPQYISTGATWLRAVLYCNIDGFMCDLGH